MKHVAIAFLLFLMSGFAVAQSPTLSDQSASLDAQRKAISIERSRLDADLSREEADCYKKFAVNNCLDKVNVRRREIMADFRRQEILLNDEERKIKGAEQIRKTEEKSSPEKLHQNADRRTKTMDDYQERLAREKEKQHDQGKTILNERAAREANTEKLLAHQKKSLARIEKQEAAADEAKKFNERQQEAQRRRVQHEADQLKRVKPSAKPLPLPE
jgi:colicin import membrane protein